MRGPAPVPPSLQLLDLVVRHTWFEQVLLVGSFRDVAARVDDAVGTHLARSAECATTIALRRLARAEVAVLTSEVATAQPPDDVVATITRLTGGNPFFVRQLGQLWHTTGEITDLPPDVSDAALRLLAPIPPTVVAALSTASVLGNAFSVDVLTVVLGTSVAEIEELTNHACAVGLLERRPRGRLEFVHDLVREALYQRLSVAERRKLHLAALEELDQRPEAPVEELAHHAYLAGPELGPARAVEYLRAGIHSARDRAALAESARLGQQLLALLPVDHHQERITTLRLQCWDLADSGQYAALPDAVAGTVAAVRATGDPDTVADIALRLRSLLLRHPPAAQPHETDLDRGASQVAELIDEAYELLGGDPAVLEPADREADVAAAQAERARVGQTGLHCYLALTNAHPAKSSEEPTNRSI